MGKAKVDTLIRDPKYSVAIIINALKKPLYPSLLVISVIVKSKTFTVPPLKHNSLLEGKMRTFHV